MKLVTYNNSYRQQLQLLVNDYFTEVHGNDSTATVDKAGDMIDAMIRDGKTIYLLLNKEEEVIAFLVVFMHDQYLMTKEVVYCDYMYVKEAYRSTRAIMYLYGMVGHICNEKQCDAIGTTFIGSSNINNNERVDGKLIANTYKFDLDKQQTYSKRYINKIMKKG